MTARAVPPGRALLVVIAASLAVVLAGCGIPAENEPRRVQPPAPSETTATATPPPPTVVPTASGQEEILYLTRDNRLVQVSRFMEQPVSPQRLLDALAATLTPDEQQQGLTSALAGTNVVDEVQVEGGIATVMLADEGLEVITQLSQGLAIAQIVCTLDARDDVTAVVFERAGARVSVPRGDGSQTDSPLTSADYATLLEPR